MAAKKTHWGAVLAAVGIAGVLYLFLHRKRPAAGGGGPSYGGGSGIPMLGGASGRGPSGGGQGGGGGIPLNSLFGGNPLKSWINKVLKQGYANAAQLPILQDNSYLSGLGTDPSLSVGGLQPLSLFDVSQLAQDISGMNNPNYPDVVYPSFADMQIPYDQTNLFDVNQLAQNISQPADLSSYGIDPYYGADQLSTVSTDFYDANNLSSFLDSTNQPVLSSGDIFSGQGQQDLNPVDYSLA